MRCYRGCKNRAKNRLLRCAKCKKKESANILKRDNWLLMKRYKEKLLEEDEKKIGEGL